MWTCPQCARIFKKENQPHSCKQVALEEHFKNKEKAKMLFDLLLNLVNKKIGKCKIVSLPCCVHLFGAYDFLAALPKKNSLEIRFALGRRLSGPKIKQTVPLSAETFKNCCIIDSKQDLMRN